MLGGARRRSALVVGWGLLALACGADAGPLGPSLDATALGAPLTAQVAPTPASSTQGTDVLVPTPASSTQGTDALAPTAEPSSTAEPEHVPVTDNFLTSLASAFGMILFSELGDKTFLIATILAMRHSRWTVFLATSSALALMTVISVAVGRVLPSLVSREVTKWVAALLLLFFGAMMVREGLGMAEDHLAEEYEEVVHELEGARSYSMISLERLEAQPPEPEDVPAAPLTTTRVAPSARLVAALTRCLDGAVPPIAIQTFSMVFLAEWGDRSQLATIVLGAAQNPWGVALGASLGHAACSLLAVVLGRALAKFLSIKSVTVLGGVLFIAFALLTLY